MRIFRIGAYVLAMALAWGGSGSALEQPGGGEEFREQRRVVEAFARAVGEGDFPAALALFDPALQVEKMDYAVFVEGTGFIYHEGLLPIPEYPGYLAINRSVLAKRMTTEIKQFVFSLLLTPEYAEGRESVFSSSYPNNVLRFSDDLGPEEIERELEELTEMLNPDNLRGLELMRVDPVDPNMQFSDRYRKAIQNPGAMYGFDDKIEFYALYRLGDRHFLGMITLYRFGESWVISNLSSILTMTGMPAGIALPVTVEEYEKTLAKKGPPK